MSKTRFPELLSPAGDIEKLTMAVVYGADAVYLGGSAFGMRAGTANFSRELLPEAVSFAHKNNVNVYVTCNTVPTDEEVMEIPAFLESVEEAKADGLIVSDIGVLALCKKYAPHTEIHISTQAGVMNSQTANTLYDLGAKRVVLARELSVDAIRNIRNNIPKDMEIEVFCHGAMCVSFSGRCTLSDYLTGRDPNRGMCAQPCRWKYHLMAEVNPGEYFEIGETDGAYILNSRDMCMISHIPELLDAGVSSLKIEGRTKSAYYVASSTAAYRHAIDAAVNHAHLPEIWEDEVNKLSHRPYSTGFFYGYPGQHTPSGSYYSKFDVVAMVESCDENGNAVLTQRNRFYSGDSLEILRPDGEPFAFTIGEMTDANGEIVVVARHPVMELHTKLPLQVPKYSFIRKLRESDTEGRLVQKD